MNLHTGTKLEHYKGGRYTVLMKGTHSESLGEMIVYQNDKDQKIWIRPINMFYEQVASYGQWVPRFEEVFE